MRTKMTLKAAVLLLLAIWATSTFPVPQDSNTIPVIDGGLGPCSAEFTVTDSPGKPVYNAKIRVHITYGFMNLHKLDLEVGTNADGKARFEGLPNRTKRGLTFYASEGDREASAFDNPANTCKAQFTLVLQKKPQ
jgi:hypothetical protein